MAARLSTALLMLAAVFAMHGLQCTTAADGAGHEATAGHAEHALSLAMTAVTPGHDHAIASAGIAPADPIAALPAARHTDSEPATPAVIATATAGHGDASHDSLAHLWTVCLAVLATALVVLLALLLPYSVPLAAPALR